MSDANEMIDSTLLDDGEWESTRISYPDWKSGIAVGHTWIGVYHSKFVDETFGNMKYVIKSNGEMIGFSGTAFDNALANVPFGKQVKFVFKGEVPSKTKGYKACKSFDIFVKGGVPSTAPSTSATMGVPSGEMESAPNGDGPLPAMPANPSFEGVDTDNIPFGAPTRVENPAYKRGQPKIGKGIASMKFCDWREKFLELDDKVTKAEAALVMAMQNRDEFLTGTLGLKDKTVSTNQLVGFIEKVKEMIE
jgi:hypothetical protein